LPIYRFDSFEQVKPSHSWRQTRHRPKARFSKVREQFFNFSTTNSDRQVYQRITTIWCLKTKLILRATTTTISSGMFNNQQTC